MKQKAFFQILIYIFLSVASFAQNYKSIKKIFKGEWYNEVTNRHLTIDFEDSSYIIINDWTGKNRCKNVVAYSAYIENGKLILPRHTEEHRAPYCEFAVQENKLFYQCEAFSIRSLSEKSISKPGKKKLTTEEVFVKVWTKK